MKRSVGHQLPPSLKQTNHLLCCRHEVSASLGFFTCNRLQMKQTKQKKNQGDQRLKYMKSFLASSAQNDGSLCHQITLDACLFSNQRAVERGPLTLSRKISGCLNDDTRLNLFISVWRPPSPPHPRLPFTLVMWKSSHNCWSMQLDPSLIVSSPPSWSERAHFLALWTPFPRFLHI